MASEEDSKAGAAPALGQEPELAKGSKLGRLRARLEVLTEEHADLLIENMSLGRKKGAAERKNVILSRIDEINEEAAALQNFLARASIVWQPSVGAQQQQLKQQQQQQQQQQPAKPTPFKMPSKDLFPTWASFGGHEPLNMRQWFTSVARVCRGHHHLNEKDWATVVALLLPAGIYQDWVWRFIENATTGADWSTLVEEFVARFQRQTSMDMLEAEWDELRQGHRNVTAYYARFIELCTVVQADITSPFVVRKFLRQLHPMLQSHLLTHYGGRVKVEAASISEIYSMCMQLEAAIIKQTQAADHNRQPQAAWCSYCQKTGHKVEDCRKKRYADSKKKTPHAPHHNNNNNDNNSNNYNNTTTSKPNEQPNNTTKSDGTPTDITCYKCQEKGHKAYACKNPRKK